MLTENIQAVLLLTCHFSKPRKEDAKPLTVSEYARFAEWLLANRFQPSSLFNSFDEIFSKWSDRKKAITTDRVKSLLSRGMAMSLALEKWQQAGIWFITRGDKEYPIRLKHKLGTQSPPVIFGLGNKYLMGAGGLAVVGSRGIGEEDVAFTKSIGHQASLESLNIVSGAAKGVDETSMLASLEAQGTALGILADSLYKAAVSAKWRKYLEADSLCLISPFYPEAGFSTGNAMGRNKYIYCLADHALVVRSDKGKGGTWAGATENLKKEWVPLFIKASEVDGNKALIDMGGNAYNIPENIDSTPTHWLKNALCDAHEGRTAHPLPNDMFSELQADLGVLPQEAQHTDQPYIQPVETDVFFSLFIQELQKILRHQNCVTQESLSQSMPDLHPAQITNWLSRAENASLIVRTDQSETYMLAS